MTSLPGAKELWRSRAPPRSKFFFWLALHGRLWTANRRRRHRLQDSDDCALCDQQSETIDHFLLNYVYSQEIWFRVLSPIGLHVLAPSAEARLADWWLSARAELPADLRKGFDSLVLLVTWFIWKERNKRIFDAAARLPHMLLAAIAEEGNSWIAAGNSGLAAMLQLLRI